MNSCSLVPHDKQIPVVRILLADDDAARAGALTKVLSADPSLTILRPRAGELLADAVAALSPDVVLVDMARPDRDALEGIRFVTSNVPRPIVLFVDQDDPAFMEEAIRAGVSSYNVLGVPPPDVKADPARRRRDVPPSPDRPAPSCGKPKASCANGKSSIAPRRF